MITSDKVKAYAMIGASIVAVYFAYKIYKGAGDAKDTIVKVLKEDLNPASDKNIIYRQFDQVDPNTGVVISSAGTRLYDATHEVDGSLKWPTWKEFWAI